jgi:cell division protein FtsB
MSAQNAFNMRDKKLRHVVGPLLVICLLVYFVYHIFQGERGILAWIRLQKKVEEGEKSLRFLESEKETLERQVYLLRPDSLDRDMLEERVRLILNFARGDEVILYDHEIPPRS